LAAIVARRGTQRAPVEGIISTARILILGVVMDSVYQWLVLKTFYPGQAAVIAVLLAFVPYLLLRGPLSALRCIGSPGPHRVEPPDFQRGRWRAPISSWT